MIYDLFGIPVIANVNAINYAILESIKIIKVANAEKN